MYSFPAILCLWRNWRQTLYIVAVLALAVFGISLTAVLTRTVAQSSSQRIELYRRVSVVLPSGLEGHHRLPACLKAGLRRNPHVALTIPMVQLSTYIPNIALVNAGYIWAVDTENFSLLLSIQGVSLKDGRLPAPRTNEIALHELLASRRGLQIGDVLDRQADPEEWLSQPMRVVGILSGTPPLSLASLEWVTRLQSLGGLPRGLILVARRGYEEDLDAELAALDTEAVSVYTYQLAQVDLDQKVGLLDRLLWAIDGTVIFVLSSLVGLLQILHFLDRLDEFGLLLAIGCRRAEVVQRVLSESLLATGIAWLAGMILSEGIYQLLSRTLFAAQGITLSLLNWHTVRYTLPIPVMASMFSVVTVFRRLAVLDPVSVIERNE